MASISLTVIVASLVLLVVGGAIEGVLTATRRASRHRAARDRFEQEAHAAEIRWAVSRYALAGHRGDELEELVCRATNAMPSEVRLAIIQHQAAAERDGASGPAEGGPGESGPGT